MKRHALVVGLNEWRDARIQPLRCAERDARELAKKLSWLRFDRVVDLLGPQATAFDVRDRVEQLAGELSEDDLLVFFFAGHGTTVGGEHYLLCHEARKDAADHGDFNGTLKVSTIRSLLRSLGDFHRLLITDACRVPLEAGRYSGEVAFQGGDSYRNLGGDSGGSGVEVLINSCENGRRAQELAEHGLFTQALLDLMGERGRSGEPLFMDAAFRQVLGERMRHLAVAANFPPDEQWPLIEEGRPLPWSLDGVRLGQRAAEPVRIIEAAPSREFVVCGLCGLRNAIEETFRCRECGRDHLCREHFDRTARKCEECAGTVEDVAEEPAMPEPEEAPQQPAGSKASAASKASKASSKGKSLEYTNSPEMKAARLFNCRGADVIEDPGSTIKKGTLVMGVHGVAVAERDVPAAAARATVAFTANATVAWQDAEYPAMTRRYSAGEYPTKEAGTLKNYCVAERTDAKGERVLFNLEVEEGANYRAKGKRAGLVSLTPEASAVELKIGNVIRPGWATRFENDKHGALAELVLKGAKFPFRWISPGKFLMGSPENEQGRYSDEGPQHEVTISRGFWMLATQVTQAHWEAVMGGNPSHFKGASLPVEKVSWQDCMGLVGKLNGLIGGLGAGLPTEAQWEYACRAGTRSAYNDGSACTQPTGVDPALEKLGWYNENSGNKTHEVGQKQPNAWGLYDCHGNVWEWCRDGQRTYGKESVTDPAGPDDGTAYRMLRGGSWAINARSCRSAYRNWDTPDSRSNFIGFRLAAGL